jgi:hypothetical protein
MPFLFKAGSYPIDPAPYLVCPFIHWWHLGSCERCCCEHGWTHSSLSSHFQLFLVFQWSVDWGRDEVRIWRLLYHFSTRGDRAPAHVNSAGLGPGAWLSYSAGHQTTLCIATDASSQSWVCESVSFSHLSKISLQRLPDLVIIAAGGMLLGRRCRQCVEWPGHV